jgi:hypothetical protein
MRMGPIYSDGVVDELEALVWVLTGRQTLVLLCSWNVISRLLMSLKISTFRHASRLSRYR